MQFYASVLFRAILIDFTVFSLSKSVIVLYKTVELKTVHYKKDIPTKITISYPVLNS